MVVWIHKGVACVSMTLLAATYAVLGGCAGETERRQARSDVTPVVRDVPAALRGTIGSEATLRGIQPVLVSGIGLVVGLDGTGGGPYPAAVQGTMEREIARQGMGKGTLNDGGPLAGMTPQQILARKDVSVVVVEGVMSPGSAKGTRFDLRVSSLPGTSTTSLEGGQLWTTELRIGPATAFGGPTTRAIGLARGAVFINPFVEVGGAVTGEGSAGDIPALAGSDGVVRTVGRVLGGGVVTEPLSLELVLDNSSHARASAMQNAINTRFPAFGGEPTAHGRGGQSIAVRVPQAYRNRGTDFVNTLMALRLDTQFAEEYAKRYVDELEKTPGLADRLEWCLEALGEPARPFVSKLYDFPEFMPRMSALRAGARLGDPRAAAYLIAEAKNLRSPVAARAEAAELLGYLPVDPSVDLALRELVNDLELEVRAAAYDGMVRRRDGSIVRIGVENKFVLDIVPSSRPLIYVVQQGEPRVVLFGDSMSLERPMLLSAWNDRLLIVSSSPTGSAGGGAEASAATEGTSVRLQYRDPRAGEGAPAREAVTNDSVAGLVRLLARSAGPENPEPGFGMSFSQVVGALYQVQKQGGVLADFATERDRLGDRLVEAQAVIATVDRPESEAKRETMKERARLLNPLEQGKNPVNPEAARTWTVPIPPKVNTKKQE